MIRLATYAHDDATLQAALDLGAQVILWDDSRISIRSWSQDRDQDWSYLQEITDAVRQHQADAQLVLNCDLIPRDRHVAMIAQALGAAASAGFYGVRFLDPGLAVVAAEHAPKLVLELATEMGNNCLASVRANAALGFRHQVLANDWPHEAIAGATTAIEDTTFETLVHGPTLIQYSDRRQVTAAIDPDADPDLAPASPWLTITMNDRAYAMADNRHGNLMYMGFDRSLLDYGDKLHHCGLTRWLIDGRGQSPAYVQAAFKGFKALRDNPHQDMTDFRAEIEAHSDRPFKPGFFLANNTDHCFEDLVQDKWGRNPLAEVVDAIKGKVITLRALRRFATNGQGNLHTPDHRITTIDLNTATDLQRANLDTVAEDQLFCLPWSKGVVTATRLEPV